MSTFRDIAESLANIQMEHFDPDNSYMALDVYVTMAKKALSEEPQSGYQTAIRMPRRSWPPRSVTPGLPVRSVMNQR